MIEVLYSILLSLKKLKVLKTKHKLCKQNVLDCHFMTCLDSSFLPIFILTMKDDQIINMV